MSLKAEAFLLTYPAPKTSEKFYVALPGSSRSLFRVSATSLPFANRTEGAIWFLGHRLIVPTSEQVGGEWSCTLEEDATLGSLAQISSLERRILDRGFREESLDIYMTDQFTGEVPQLCVSLNDVWLKNVKEVALDWSKPTDKMSYQLIFAYSSLSRWY